MKYHVLILLVLFISCKDESKNSEIVKPFTTKNLNYQGRVDFLKDSTLALISPGSSISFNFSGNFCEVYLKSEFRPHSYISIEIDGEFLEKIKIEADSIKPYQIKIPSKNKTHTVQIFKETEASNGSIIIEKIVVDKIEPIHSNSKKYIEFIGNSITCGAASDSTFVKCDEGEYFDHQNVYYSYGSRVARALDADFMLSSVSGIGIYRNWNDENIEEPIMPQVYENLYLNTDNSKKYDFSKKPDIVSICLGTNDFSNGDGIKNRLHFNKEKFISNYINFIKTVYSHYPKTKIILLNSPMIDGETNLLFISYLEEIQEYFLKTYNKEIPIYQFKKLYVNGCSYHPSVEEHGKMAEELIPVYNNLLNN